jgi:RHS repeat-associated protein
MKYIIKVTDWAGRETGYAYDDAGRLTTTTTRPNGTVRTQMYDLAGQIRLIEERGPSNELLWLRACKYDLNGNIIETISSPTETTNWTLPDDTLTYDADNRLVTWNSFAVTHDADGNMTNGPLPGGTDAVHTYDMFDRLASVGGVASTYNPDGLRVRAGGVSYVVDPNGGLSKPLLRQQGGTATKYVWGLGLIYEETGGNIKTYHADHLGSTVALTNASGAVIDRWEYSSYGTQTYRTGTSDTPFQFHGLLGCMTDANGLVYMRARYYNPRLMRFLYDNKFRTDTNALIGKQFDDTTAFGKASSDYYKAQWRYSGRFWDDRGYHDLTSTGLARRPTLRQVTDFRNRRFY